MRTSPPRSRSTAGVATSSSPLPQAAGRVPSPGACIEDCRRAPDRQFNAAKHPFGEGVPLCTRTPFLYREKERGSFRAEAQGRRGFSNCWAWNSSEAENQEPRTKNQEPRTKNHYELRQTSERGLVFRTSPIPEATASGPEGRQKVAQRVSAGFRPTLETSPGRGDRSPDVSLRLAHRTGLLRPERIPHARFAQDAKTPRQPWNGIHSSSFPPWRLCVFA
jgi:hypothetical protein